MKKSLLIAAILLPASALAQIYPLQEYAKATRDNGQELKFLHSPHYMTYVATCKGMGESKLCDLAKNGNYKTSTGVTFIVKNGTLYSPENADLYCDYVNKDSVAKLECEDRD